MAFEAAKEEAAKLGMTVDIFTSDQNDARFQDLVNQCANQGYDGMFISHGNKNYSYDLIKPLADKGIKVVTFDTGLGDGIPGVTEMYQNDQELARLTLDYICNEMFPDSTGPIRVLKLWYGPGADPFDRREETYKEFQDKGKIETLEVIGPSDMSNQEGSITTLVGSVLPKYPEDSIDVIWGVYDTYTRGAYKAVLEAGRNIPMVSVDISNQDINYMRDGNDMWKACAAVDFRTVGQQGVRLLAMKLHGDETPDEYKLPPSLITADQLTPEANVSNLSEIVDGYGKNDENITDWMKEAYARTGK